MSGSPDNLKKQLELFNISGDEAEVYLYLLQNGVSTALKMSRELNIARTKIYRLIDKLLNKGLITERIDGYGKKFEAESYERLNQLIQTKDQELEAMRQNAPNLFNQLAALSLQAKEESKILHYRGEEGLKQVSWNSTKVNGDFRIYEVESLEYVVEEEFAEKCRKQYSRKPSNRFFQLTNLKKIKDWTKIVDFVPQWEVRHIPKKELDIRFEVQIYNNIYAMYEYTGDDVFIVEIYNQKLADMQKQIYDLIFKNAKKMKKTSRFGAAEVV